MAEGTAMAALPHMKGILESWPCSFPSIESCIEWSVRNHHPTSVVSAEKSIPPSLRQSSPEGPYVFRTRLAAFESNWESWFLNYNSAFLDLSKVNTPHILLLSAPERMDNELTIAQMQGKFQLKLIQGGCGEHFLHVSCLKYTLFYYELI
jgi:protein phosphatase methylesterase 1